FFPSKSRPSSQDLGSFSGIPSCHKPKGSDSLRLLSPTASWLVMLGVASFVPTSAATPCWIHPTHVERQPPRRNHQAVRPIDSPDRHCRRNRLSSGTSHLGRR